MPSIAFIDTEVDPNSKKILDIGGVRSDKAKFHSPLLTEFKEFIQPVEYLCGHNIIEHDKKYLDKWFGIDLNNKHNFIDTLYLSPLLYPEKPYHRLVKDDKLDPDNLNNPYIDATKARDLFYDELNEFGGLDNRLKSIFYNLLKDSEYFRHFFGFAGNFNEEQDLAELINSYFSQLICSSRDLNKYIRGDPVAFAYSLALISCDKQESITPPWVLHHFPNVERIVFQLRSEPCLNGCEYCNQSFDAKKGLKDYFGFDTYRDFDGVPLQEEAVNAALHNESLLAIFPTGGGKSLAFQVPALMAGRNSHALTVIISPLQSLMKDQVDNLEKKGITDAVTINGLLDPIERGKSIERVREGIASILYISPELLRSKTIENLFLDRKIARFVIDEAHCFSSWGHDFRVDYLYIGDFIKNLQRNKSLPFPIPVSCFTATAKPQVIEDIQQYFKEKLQIDLKLLKTSTTRKNLHYNVFDCANEKEKYERLRHLIDSKPCPTIVYVSRTRKAQQVAEALTRDGYAAKPFHGKMDPKLKTKNQDAFMSGETDIIVATSAFGMGVDKDNVERVVHFDISDSLENYVQEAGRAGRKETISAECYVLFNEDDLGKHFILLNQTKIDIHQIQEVWKAIKGLTRFRETMSNSALEIARKAGWNDQVDDLETRVTTSIAALEEAGYVKRIHNSPRIFATSILTKNTEEAILRINNSPGFDEKQKTQSIRIIKNLIASKSRYKPSEEIAESRVDYISDHLGIPQKDVIRCIYLMRDEKILADTKDLSVSMRPGDKQGNAVKVLQDFAKLELFLFDAVPEKWKILHVKELNEAAQEAGCNSTPSRIITILNFWSLKKWIEKKKRQGSNDHFSIHFLQSKEELKERIDKRHVLAGFFIQYLYEKTGETLEDTPEGNQTSIFEFSVHELMEAYEKKGRLFNYSASLTDVEDSLFFLSRIEALTIEGGFLVVYNRLNIQRIEQNLRRQYKLEDYEALKTHYNHKIQQIHIVGEYAKKMLADYKSALIFVDDYFQLNYSIFINKYFPGSRRDEIKKSITPARMEQLFGALSPAQLEIINDRESQYLVVAAGPGSGKTKLLVHKLASIVQLEEIKYEQLIMLTFSRAAATEFKKRLMGLIGNAALYIEIKTFHSFCFDLLGQKGSIERSENVIIEAVQKIREGEVEPGRIAKVVLVIDEAQDITADEYELIKALIEENPEMKVIAVGDDDQNIYEFRGADSKYFREILDFPNSKKYELLANFRSKANLVDFSNHFARSITQRLKKTDIQPVQLEDGTIEVVNYASDNLVIPVVDDIISTDLSGTTCVLTAENKEATFVAGYLNTRKMPAKLIQSNTGFNLLNLNEVRYFLRLLKAADHSPVFSDEQLDKAKREFNNEFGKSAQALLCLRMIREFELIHPKTKYISDLELFISESKMEDFAEAGTDTVLVSTMHKAKGKEFDNVYLMLNHFDFSTDEKRRLLYVAMTRAKQRLVIHYNGTFEAGMNLHGLTITSDYNTYALPNEISIQLTHKDVNLGYFKYVQRQIKPIKSGDILWATGPLTTDPISPGQIPGQSPPQRQVKAWSHLRLPCP
jgi:ATP-dependent DNA helicase RecQ